MGSVDMYHAYLLGYLRSMTSHHDAEDVLQELWKFVVLYFPEDKIQCLPLLRRKAYQLFIDQYRRTRAHNTAVDKAKDQPVPTRHEHFENEAEEARLQAKFWAEFPVKLTDQQKAVLWHFGRYGLTYEEIEEKLGVKASTACDWVKAGRRLLRQYLDEN